MTAADLAKRIGVPNNRVYQIVNGKRDITADTALRLGQFFGTGPELWMNLQKAYELDVGRQEIGDKLKRIKRYAPAHPHSHLDNLELTETMATAKTTAPTFRNDTEIKADYRLINPLINLNDWRGELRKDDTRWGHSMPPASNANSAWVQYYR